MSSTPTAHYQLSWPTPPASTYQVELTTEKARGSNTHFQLPAWRPGRYILQNFAAAVSNFKAFDEAGASLAVVKVDKDTWQVSNPRGKRIRIQYEVYARTLDAGSSYLGPQLAYFNPATLFMYVPGSLDSPCTLVVPSMPRGWMAATQLGRTATYNVFTASSYHDLVDSPTILSPHIKTISFETLGVQFTAHFQGNYQAGPAGDSAYLSAMKRLVQEQTAVFGELPLQEYHFIYLLCPLTIRHAVEHMRSAMFVVSEEVASSNKSLAGIYGITSHEFWHLWNVKRIRPAAMWPYQYHTEAYTSLHWFTEGVTDYYSKLMLARAGLITQQQLLTELSNTITGLENTYAQHRVAPIEASYDSWLAPSRYADPRLRVSYYDLGTRAGFLLDLALRQRTQGKVSLDDVFQYLYTTYYKKNKGVPEDGILLAAEAVSGLQWGSFFKTYIDGRAPYDYDSILNPIGLQLLVTTHPDAGLRRLGIERSETSGSYLNILSIQPESDAALAGVPENCLLSKAGDATQPEDIIKLINALKPGEQVTLETISTDGLVSHILTFTGKQEPHNYKLQQLSQSPYLKDWATAHIR